MLARRHVALLLIFAALGFNCTKSDPPTVPSAAGESVNAIPANKTMDNAEELATVVNLPFEPEEAAWRIETAPSSAQQKSRKLTAVLLFSPANASRLVEQAERSGKPEPVKVPAETWFPTELASRTEMDGEGKLSGTRLAATAFISENFRRGSLVRVNESDYFILELFEQ